MKRLNNKGVINGLAIAFILSTTLFVFASVFGVWAYSSRADFKSNTDKKIATAVNVAQKQTSDKKDAEFLDKERSQLTFYQGPAVYGSVSMQYPKLWSAVINENVDNTTVLNTFFNPHFIPQPALLEASGPRSIAFALRMQIAQQSYSSILVLFANKIADGTIKTSAYNSPNVPGVTGVKLDGEVALGKQGSMIIFPLRDKTLQIWTEAKEYLPDFNNSVLKSLKFVP